MPEYEAGFESLYEETDVASLPVEGEVPAWLSGTLVRNGPAQFEVGDDAYNHWFDGLAMLHAFRMADGEVGYRNRFLETTSRAEAQKADEISRAEFATDPCRSIFRRFMAIFRPRLTDNASINVARLAGEWVALTETPLPVAFDPETLDTAGVVDYTDDLDAPMTTAHPHTEPGTRRTITYVTEFGRQCRYHVCAIDPGSSRRRVLATLDVDAPSYMHSFALTEQYAVLSEWPLVVRPLDLLLEGKPFIENFDWEPGRGTRFRVIRLSDGEEVARVEADPAFAFHHVNAFERGGEVVCDVVTYDDASIIDALYLDRLRADEPTPAVGALRRYRLPLSGGSARESVRSDTRLELPRVYDDRVEARPYEVVYGIGQSDRQDETVRAEGDFTDAVVKIDVETGMSRTWHEEGTYPGEPVFVPAPDGTAEDDGVLLSVVLDARASRSFLLVLDAKTLTERARATVPHAIPFGFHGQYLGR